MSNIIGVYFNQNYITCSYIKNLDPILYKKYKYNNYEFYDGIIFNYTAIVKNINEFIKAYKIYNNLENLIFVFCLPENHILENHNQINPDIFCIQNQTIFDDYRYRVGIKHETLAQFNFLVRSISEKSDIKDYIFTTRFLALYSFLNYDNKIKFKDSFEESKKELEVACSTKDLFIEKGLYLLGKIYENNKFL